MKPFSILIRLRCDAMLRFPSFWAKNGFARGNEYKLTHNERILSKAPHLSTDDFKKVKFDLGPHFLVGHISEITKLQLSVTVSNNFNLSQYQYILDG